jgi:hypothetical protein
LAIVRASPAHAVSVLWRAEAHALSAWLLIGSPAVLFFYFLLSRGLRQLACSGPFRSSAGTA